MAKPKPAAAAAETQTSETTANVEAPPAGAPSPAYVPEHIMQFFAFTHLPETLQNVAKPFVDLADRIMSLPRNPERTVALRKLLESKDAAVRAALAK